ncbi:apoptotic chromatin condensation inducer in the nucleus isoform X2 [Osmerus eperlanus]|uniref:apoptotic chromatin condensation inducer in the nucleus isoform X2 n=1 Tax=Osmerus eperlanus TaxID=29151 RepID=UPI002E144CD8
MADLEDVTLDGRPLHSLRVADLKAALEERGLPKSGQKNALVKRLKGALMLENLQRTSTPHIGLQPNSQIGEEMSQNSFIKQYLAKQQELLRQRLEREAREAAETDEQENLTEVNNSSPCPADQDVAPVLGDQPKPLGPPEGEAPAGPASMGDGYRAREGHMSGGPLAPSSPTSAPGAVASLRVAGGEQRPERVPTSSQVPDDSDDDDSDGGDEDGEDEDWDANARRRRSLGEPARGQPARERSGGSHQPPPHIPQLLSQQLRQPTPPPSPPPELSFPLPDTPKQSPPSPGEPPARQRTSSTSSSGSSSSGSRSSSPEPQSGHVDRKPGPLTLLARKMESEGAFSGAGWHGRVDGERQDSSAANATVFPGRGPQEGTVSAITHTANPAAGLPYCSMIPGKNQGVLGVHVTHGQVPVSVLRATGMEERDMDREQQIEREREMALEQERLQALELERRERQRLFEQERAMEQERQKVLEKEREEKERALERERVERERQEQERALQREREERERALAKEREEREKALARERALQLEREKELERQRVLEQERAIQQEREERERALQREKEERERELQLERARALEREREELARALEQERMEKERALERERMEREKVLAREREERMREERERVLMQERMERERALEQERMEKERALEQERLDREKVLEQERLEKERAQERERLEKERAQERERLERLEKERAQERERLEKERAQERERLEKERAQERERLEKEKALERERLEKEKALERERLEKERAQERERLEKERALEREREMEKEKDRERALKRERQEMERALEQEKTLQREKEETERAVEQEKERLKMAERERESHLPPWKRGRELGLTPLPTPPPLSTGAGRMAATTEGREQEGGEPEATRRDNQPAASGTPLSPSLKTPLSPQSSSKKSRFLRDAPLLPHSSSAVIKRPRTFSDGPHPQASPFSSPFELGEQKEEGPQSTSEKAVLQMPSRQGVLVSAPPVAHGSGVIASLCSHSQGDNARTLTSEGNVQMDKGETEKRALEELAKKGKGVDAGKIPSSPVGAKLPLSSPPEAREAERRRGRDEKREEKRGTRASSSSDSSSSDSDSGSSSSHSSGSSSSSQEKANATASGRRPEKRQRNSSAQDKKPARHENSIETPKVPLCKRGVSEKEKKDMSTDGDKHSKKPFHGKPTGQDDQQRRETSDGVEDRGETAREMKQGAMAESEKAPEASEESLTPKAFTARKISLSSSKASPGTGNTEGEVESGGAAGRKRRWGSSTAVTAKKPSISITTDSLKSLIPDIRPCPGQEAVVDLHPEEAHLSGGEEDNRELPDQELKIRRTVTQVVPSESQENGQKEAKRSRCEDEEREDGGELKAERERGRSHEEKMNSLFPAAMETQSPSPPSHDMDIDTVTPGDTLIRRSISQQKSGVSITIDDPVRTARQPSPPRGKVSNIVHVSNLVRPFTLGQLKELLGRTGSVLEEGFWIDKIKSHCYVTYPSPEEAVATRAALHGVKWPQSNPKFLNVDFSQKEELDFHRGLSTDEKAGDEAAAGPGRGRPAGPAPLLPERDQWAEREREVERRERARAEREWDRDKVRDFGKPGEEREGGPRRSRSRERRRKERGKSKEKKTDKKEKAAEEPPAKMLDDLFCKTKAAPCIYWLPLTDEQFAQREAARAERVKERERKRKEMQDEEDKKREEERKERMKAGGGTGGDRGEGERGDRDRDRERDRGRDRDREGDKRREAGYRRPGGSSAGGGRRSRSRSDPPPRDRRR